MSARIDKFLRAAAQPVLPAHRVIQTSETARVGSSHPGGAGHHASSEPTIDLVREGDLVKAIDVTCSCGEKFRIWCSYVAE